MTRKSFLALLAGLATVTSGAALADTTYTIRSLVVQGDRAGDLPLGGAFRVNGLDERGRFVFSTGLDTPRAGVFLYDQGKLTPIVVSGADRPGGGKWPAKLAFAHPISMNQRGNIALGIAQDNGAKMLGVFLWDAGTRQVTPVVTPEMPAVDGATFVQVPTLFPMINNRNEIAFPALIQDAALAQQHGVFLRSEDGRLQTVALSNQALPDGGTIRSVPFLVIDDEGRAAVTLGRKGQETLSAYLWEQGSLTPIAVVGGRLPDGGTIKWATYTVPDNQGRSAWVSLRREEDKQLSDGYRPEHLYRWAEGRLTPVLKPGQEMPGGGIYQRLDWVPGFANKAGQLPFMALVTGGGQTRRACYLAGTDGKVSLVLKEGMSTDLGTIKSVGGSAPWGGGPAINNKGEIALVVQFADGLDRIALLTPNAP